MCVQPHERSMQTLHLKRHALKQSVHSTPASNPTQEATGSGADPQIPMLKSNDGQMAADSWAPIAQRAAALAAPTCAANVQDTRRKKNAPWADAHGLKRYDLQHTIAAACCHTSPTQASMQHPDHAKNTAHHPCPSSSQGRETNAGQPMSPTSQAKPCKQSYTSMQLLQLLLLPHQHTQGVALRSNVSTWHIQVG